MNVKNLNPLERHVEKIVLAVAVLGAGYIGYLATQPITIPDTTVKPGEVEQKVTQAVENLQGVRKNVLAKGDLTPRLKNYVQEYADLMQKQPLKQELVASTAVPQFAPLQEGADASVGDPNGMVKQNMQVVTPVVPLPKNVTAVASRASVAITPPPIPGAEMPPPPTPGTPAPAGQTKDLNWVTISGRIPLADFIAEMNDPALQPNQKLVATDQRAVLYRVEVQRRTHNNGSWSAWEPVAPTKVNGDPITVDWKGLSDNDLPPTVAGIDGAFRKIAWPDFYTLASGQPIIPAILSTPDPSAATKPATTGAPAVAPHPPLMPPGRSPQQGMDDEGNIIGPGATPGAPAAAAVPGMPDLTTLRQQPNVPFWFYDENVAPNEEYQYEVRLVMYNPTYRYPSGLKNPKMKDEPTIASNWVVVPSTVTVNSDLYFFVDNAMGNGGAGASGAEVKVGFRLFKWTNGNWYGGEAMVTAGMPVSGTVNVRALDKPTVPVDAATGYTLVDVLPSPSGSELTAVLLSPGGELVTRSSRTDQARTNAMRQDLEKQANAVLKAAAPPPPPPKPRVIPTPQPGRNAQPTDQ